ncbi:MAG TPA: hypothetical protein VMG37_00505 [Solirubrobacteraceae bacterium]|nr:hypothetical protein [Solirubrobacteraceae bacterium]
MSEENYVEMRRWTIAILAGSALAVSACGSTARGVTTPRPAAPVDLTVYIDNHSVSVSPTNVGAGPVAFVITNQASQAESLSILRAGASAGQPLADTGPINPQGTSQVTVNFSSPGTYSVATGGADPSSGAIRTAQIHIGAKRGSSDNQLLQP